MSPDIRGIVPILVTPFDEAGGLDIDSLTRLVEFNIEQGVHGLGIAIGSELFKLTDDERDAVIRTVVAAARGRVPIVVNTGAGGTNPAIHYSKRAEAAGADALMVIPPFFMPVAQDEVLDYYESVSRAVSVPVFMQDVPQAPISPSLAVRIAGNCENIKYIKVETLPIIMKVAAMVEVASDQLRVFGGAGGSYFIEEMRRGVQGTMPYCSQPAAFVEVWDAFQAGDEARAKFVFERHILPVNRLASQGLDTAYHLHKQLLVEQGVIRSATVRGPSSSLDAMTKREIGDVIRQVVSSVGLATA